MKSGIYQIRNLQTGCIYVGSASSFKKRWSVHKGALKNNKHHSKYLQYSWNKHGEENFLFEILATCPKEYLVKLEQWFLDTLKPRYNKNKFANSMLGVKQSPETIEKRKRNTVFKPRPDYVKKAISESNKGRSAWNKGRTTPLEHRRTVSEQERKNISKRFKGRKLSEKTKDKLRQARLGIKLSIEHRRNISKNNTGKRAIVQFTITGEYIQEWESINAAAKFYNVTKGALGNAVRGLKPTCKGFKWKFKNDYYADK